MKIGVVGAGAMGSFLGGHLQQGGHDVTLIDIWQDHIDTINKCGLMIHKVDNKMVVPQIIVAIWEKLAFNAAMNGLAAILNINVGELGDSDMGRKLAITIVAEVVSVARKKYIQVQEERILATMDMAFIEHREHLPSMLKDIKSGKPTEVEAIHGVAIQEGHKLGLTLPVCETVYSMIWIIEAQTNR